MQHLLKQGFQTFSYEYMNVCIHVSTEFLAKIISSLRETDRCKRFQSLTNECHHTSFFSHTSFTEPINGNENIIRSYFTSEHTGSSLSVFLAFQLLSLSIDNYIFHCFFISHILLLFNLILWKILFFWSNSEVVNGSHTDLSFGCATSHFEI